MELTNQAPANNSIQTRRDWSLTVDITDAAGITNGSIVLQVNGVTVTPTLTSITNGYRAEFIPASQSSYGERITVTVTATPVSGSPETIISRFTIVTGQISATSSPPPYVVAARDIGLTTDESDENEGGVNVIWLDDITHPLIVTEAQAAAVGKVEVDNNTFHKHKRNLQVYRTDANADVVASLQEGDLITFTAAAKGETAQKAEVLAIRQKVDKDDDVLYELQVKYYEAVS